MDQATIEEDVGLGLSVFNDVYAVTRGAVVPTSTNLSNERLTPTTGISLTTIVIIGVVLLLAVKFAK